MNKIIDNIINSESISKIFKYIFSIILIITLSKPVIETIVTILYNIYLIVYYITLICSTIALLISIICLLYQIEELMLITITIIKDISNQFKKYINNNKYKCIKSLINRFNPIIKLYYGLNNIIYKLFINPIINLIFIINDLKYLIVNKYSIKLSKNINNNNNIDNNHKINYYEKNIQDLNQYNYNNDKIKITPTSTRTSSSSSSYIVPLESSKIIIDQINKLENYESDLEFDTDDEYTDTIKNQFNGIEFDQDIEYYKYINFKENYDDIQFDKDDQYSNLYSPEKELWCDYDYSFHSLCNRSNKKKLIF